EPFLPGPTSRRAGSSAPRANPRWELSMISQAKETLVIIGNGMAGARVAEEIPTRGGQRYSIIMFCDAPFAGYDRVRLSGVLGAHVEPDDIVQRPFEWYEEHGIRLHAGIRADHIDLERRVVVGKNGKLGGHGRHAIEEPFDRLILATGSRPLV